MKRTTRPRPSRYRTRERQVKRRLPRQPTSPGCAARDVLPGQWPWRHPVSTHRRLSRSRHRLAKSRVRQCAQPGLHQRLSRVERRGDRELSARSQLRSRQPGAGGGRTPAGRAADREPSRSDRRSGTAGRPADSQQRRASRRCSGRRDAGGGAAQLRTAPLRGWTVNDISRHAGATRPPGGAGESAPDQPRLRVGDCQLRGDSAGPAPRCRRHRGCQARGCGRGPNARAAWDLPSGHSLGPGILGDVMNRPIAVIGAPSSIGIRPYDDGVVRHIDRAPGVLRERGLIERLGAIDLGDVASPPYRDYVRPFNRARNEDQVIVYSRSLSARVAEATSRGRFGVVLGGDCSIVLGCLLGARRTARGAVGLAYMDAHADFATPDESRTGSVASMSLALASGRGDTPLARLAGRTPLVDGKHVALVGRRDAAEFWYGHAALPGTTILDVPDAQLIAEHGCDQAAALLDRVASPDVKGFWIHLDAAG